MAVPLNECVPCKERNSNDNVLLKMKINAKVLAVKWDRYWVYRMSLMCSVANEKKKKNGNRESLERTQFEKDKIQQQLNYYFCANSLQI